MGGPGLRWKAFSFENKEYDLGHLHPKTVRYFQPAQGTKLHRGYTVHVTFSLHCFTRSMENQTPDPALSYSDHRETRLFDFRRYALSHRLPQLIESLMSGKCYRTDRANFFLVHVLDDNGNEIDYEVYFAVSTASQGGLNLFVQSAYVRDTRHRGNRSKPISFAAILYSVLK